MTKSIEDIKLSQNGFWCSQYIGGSNNENFKQDAIT